MGSKKQRRGHRRDGSCSPERDVAKIPPKIVGLSGRSGGDCLLYYLGNLFSLHTVFWETGFRFCCYPVRRRPGTVSYRFLQQCNRCSRHLDAYW